MMTTLPYLTLPIDVLNTLLPCFFRLCLCLSVWPAVPGRKGEFQI